MFDRIRRRLTMGYVGILAIILIVFGAVVLAGFREMTVSQHDSLLTKEARGISDTFARGGSVDMQGMDDSDDYAWAHLAADGRLLASDSTAKKLGLPVKKSSERVLQGGEPDVAIKGAARVASVPVVESGEVVGVVQVGQSIQADLETVNRLVWVLIPIGAGALLLAGIGGLFMSQRALRPVRGAFDKQRAFIADASHELKTPLSLVKIDGEVLLRDPAAPDAREILEHQLLEVDRTSEILSDLLLLSRLDSGKLDVDRKTFDLASVLTETVDRFQTVATAAGITLDVSVSGKLPVRGDKGRTGQILAALLDNAVRFTPESGCITVHGTHRGKMVEATVIDTGPGVPAEHLPYIFDRFYRADRQRDARTRQGGGTGLGLAIARDLARSLGGDLSADNTETGGAEFQLNLPQG